VAWESEKGRDVLAEVLKLFPVGLDMVPSGIFNFFSGTLFLET
jgi:hypothetical protein